jgi:hypothetical protein
MWIIRNRAWLRRWGRNSRNPALLESKSLPSRELREKCGAPDFSCDGLSCNEKP